MISTQAADQSLYVGAGQGGAVEILELQPAGKRRMAAGEFLRGAAIHDTWRLGGDSP